MGTLIYGVAPAIEIEDRTLKHLQAVIVTKLRRDESFAFNWDGERGVGEDEAHHNGEHGTVWISRSTMLYFRYDGARHERLNPAWIDAMMVAAYSARGLSAVPEPPSPAKMK